LIDAVQDVAEIIVVTSGIRHNWINILKNHNIDSINLIGGSNFNFDEYVVDSAAKGIITEQIRASGRIVYAFGDTLIDLDMLIKADFPFLVVNEKMNKDILPFLTQINGIKQLSFKEGIHREISQTTVEKIIEQIIY
jgi:hypothetical protein